MTTQPDRQDGDGLRAVIFGDSSFILDDGTTLNFEGRTLTQIWQRLFDVAHHATPQPTRDAAEGARERILTAEEERLMKIALINSSEFAYDIAPPKPAPDAMREPLFKREQRGGGYAFVTAPAFPGWSFVLTPVCPEAREQEMRLSLVAFLEAEATLSAPVPPADGAPSETARLLETAAQIVLAWKADPAIAFEIRELIHEPSCAGAAEPVRDLDRVLNSLMLAIHDNPYPVVRTRLRLVLKEILQPLYAAPPVRGDQQWPRVFNVKRAENAWHAEISFARHPTDAELQALEISLRDDHQPAPALPVQPGAGEREAADQIIGDIEKRFPDWKSYRDLVDCIDVTMHNLRRGPQ